MKIRNTLALVLLSLCLAWAMGPRACQADVTFQVQVNTAPLIGHPAAPFAINFQLNDGSGTNDGNNTATISGFTFGGGGPAGVPILTGGASGDLSSVVTLTDSTFFNDFVQDFTPGASLAFTVDLTTNTDAGPTPDLFSFAILDGSGFEIPTTSPIGGFVIVDITGPNPTIQSYSSDATTPVPPGDPVDIPAPTITVANTTPIPEPSSALVFLATLLAVPACYAWRHARGTMARPAIGRRSSRSLKRSDPWKTLG